MLIEDIFSAISDRFHTFFSVRCFTHDFDCLHISQRFSDFNQRQAFQDKPILFRVFFEKFERLAILLRNLKSNQIFFQIEKYFSFKSKFKNSCKSEPDQEKINFSVQEESMMRKYPNRSLFNQVPIFEDDIF